MNPRIEILLYDEADTCIVYCHDHDGWRRVVFVNWSNARHRRETSRTSGMINTVALSFMTTDVQRCIDAP